MPEYLRNAQDVVKIFEKMKKFEKYQHYNPQRYTDRTLNEDEKHREYEQFLANVLERDFWNAMHFLSNGPTVFKSLYHPGYHCKWLCQIAQEFEEKGMPSKQEIEMKLRVMYKELLQVLTNHMNYRIIYGRKAKNGELAEISNLILIR